VLICGLLANKDAEAFFDAFRTLNPRIIATAFSAEAASPPERLVSAAIAAGLRASAAGNVEAALEQALAVEGPPPRVMVCGSLYLAGEVLALSRETWPD
jgi:dihydrofolate synthase/folylpolyglutamate synthase